MLLPRVFRLKRSAFAILTENDQPIEVEIPPKALVTVIVGDTGGDGLVKIRYQQKILVMLAVDLRRQGEPILYAQQSA